MPGRPDADAQTGEDFCAPFLAALAERLQIEEPWIQHESRGFRWWPGPLAQRVWADPLRTVGKHKFSRIHIESDFLAQPAQTEKAAEMAAMFNCVAVLSCIVLNPVDGRLRVHASVCLGDDNADEVLRLAMLVAALQVADVSAKSASAPALFEAALDTSAHPSNGVRTEGHEMLRALETVRDHNQESEPASRIDFGLFDELEPKPWVLGVGGVGGLTAEYACSGNTPALIASVAGQAPETSLLQVTTDFEHPQLGHGVLLRLTIPTRSGGDFANTLNLREVSEGPRNADQLGGWCDTESGPTFVSFLPSCLVDHDWLASLMYDHNIRSSWARDVLGEFIS